MKTNYEYIQFVLTGKKPKTDIWSCYNNRSRYKLGMIKWHSQWRQYCFFSEGDSLYSKGCLADIADFISQIMEERKRDRKE